jgi:1-phosphatidylinositol-4-phosphate 5-kinase
VAVVTCGFLDGAGVAQHGEKRIVFVDYAPDAFAEIRRLSGVEPVNYIMSLSTTKRERFTEGASGAFLYFSGDGRFIVKTLSRSDRLALLALLPAYLRHLRAHPQSLLVRFLGCHAARMYGHEVELVVMDNVLRMPTAPPLPGRAVTLDRYDLKGSWVNRKASMPKRGEVASCKHCGKRYEVRRALKPSWRPASSRLETPLMMGSIPAAGEADACPARGGFQPHEPSVLLKDSDLDLALRLRAEQAASLRERLGIDAGFLQSQGIMDYSLLLSVRRETEGVPDSSSDASSRPGVMAGSRQPRHQAPGFGPERDASGSHGDVLRSDNLSGSETYALGIVDVLQRWDTGKAAERCGKTVFRCNARYGVSAVPPGPYAQRFYDRVVLPLTVAAGPGWSDESH